MLTSFPLQPATSALQQDRVCGFTCGAVVCGAVTTSQGLAAHRRGGWSRPCLPRGETRANDQAAKLVNRLCLNPQCLCGASALRGASSYAGDEREDQRRRSGLQDTMVTGGRAAARGRGRGGDEWSGHG